MDETEVQDAILQAGAAGRTLEIVGGGSKATLGATRAADGRLDMSGLDAVIDYDPPELILTAQPGARLEAVERLLEASGQMLAFEPMDYGPLLGLPAGQGTLGGMIAANAAGPRRLTAGAVRDHFLGFSAVSGRGDIFKAGGKVVKNVTGYDLPKVLAGSWGTLAALTEVTLKVLPRPRSSATLVLRGLTDAQACEAMGACLGSPTPVTAAAHLPRGWEALTGPATLLRLEGVEPSIVHGIDAIGRLLPAHGGHEVLGPEDSRRLWRHISDVGPFQADPRSLWRVSVAPADGWRLVEALAERVAEAVYDWAGGLVWLAMPPEADGGAKAVRPVVARLGGHATLVRAPVTVRARISTFPPQPPALTALSARVKAAFDPQGVLGPRHDLSGAPPEAD